MPRRGAIHMRLSNAAFHPFDAFLRILFEETLPLCFLRSNGVLIKAQTQRPFEMDNQSLNNVRKSLLLALCCYATHNRRLPTKVLFFIFVRIFSCEQFFEKVKGMTFLDNFMPRNTIPLCRYDRGLFFQCQEYCPQNMPINLL